MVLNSLNLSLFALTVNLTVKTTLLAFKSNGDNGLETQKMIEWDNIVPQCFRSSLDNPTSLQSNPDG